MMLYRTYLATMLAALLLLFGSCTHNDPQPVGDGVITVTVQNTTVLTKSNLSEGLAIDVDGSRIPDLLVVITNSDGDFVAWWPDDYYGAMTTGYSSECENNTYVASTPVSESSIFFTGPTRGTYTVYAVANINGLPDAAQTALLNATDASDLESIQLSVASGEPDFDDLMPLTAKGTLTVNSSSNGQIDLQLKRPVARVTLILHNQTGEALDVHACSVTIPGMNPSRGYLFERATDYVSGYDRSVSIVGTDPLVFTENRCTLEVKQVFPSTAPAQTLGNRYLCSIEFRVTNPGDTYDSSDTDTYRALEFPDLPVHDNRSADIPYLKRNQQLNIVTRITKAAANHDVSFNFEVQSWTVLNNYVEFSALR